MVTKLAEKVACETSIAVDGAVHGEEEQSRVLTNCANWAGELCESCPGSREQLLSFSFQHGLRQKVGDAVCFLMEESDLQQAWQREIPAAKRNAVVSLHTNMGHPPKFHFGKHDHQCRLH